MRWLVVLAACGAAPPAKPTPVPPTPVIPPPLVFRQLHLGASHASRTTFELALIGDRATLIETEERAPDAATWTRVSTRTYRGPRRDAELELSTDDMQPLALHCESRTVTVATKLADDCTGDRGAIVHVDALVCTAAGQSAADADADDQLVFAAAPGVEWLDAACGGSLRQPRP